MEYKKGDWCFHDYELVQILEVDGGRITEVSDGSFRKCGNSLDVQPLSLRNNRLCDYWTYYERELRKAEGRTNLNWPDIHRYFVDTWNQACLTETNEGLVAIQDTLKKFVDTAIAEILGAKQKEIDGVGLFR